MALDLSKLAGQVSQMGSSMAERQRKHAERVAEAKARLAEWGAVSDDLLNRVTLAHNCDQSWRGAEPLCERMDLPVTPVFPHRPLTIIATDGSQVYPDRHGIAAYFLLNTGGVVLRQDSGQAPAVEARPHLFYEDCDLYDEMGQLRNLEYINRQRDRRELQHLVELVEAERSALGGDISEPILALTDGPLLPWLPQRAPDADLAAEVSWLTTQLDQLRKLHAIPVGYVDRPSSSYILRTLELTYLSPDEINRNTVRKGKFRLLSDRALFPELEPNQRTGLFASTSEINYRYAERGHRIAFFYANIARKTGCAHATIARLEIPEWASRDRETVDLAQQAVFADSAMGGYPYVLTRAHEMAVVRTAERADLESMLERCMLRSGLQPAASAKARQKQLVGARR